MAISQIPNTFIVKYEDNMRLALQQQESKLWGLCPVSQGVGEKVKLDDIVGNVKGQKRATRNQDTNITDATHDRVWVVAPDPIDNGFLVDTMDQLESGIQLQAGYVMANAGMIARAKDDAFLGGFFGNMLTGKSGTVSTAFSGSMVVPVTTGAAAAARMNIEKLRYARKLLAKGFVDMNEEWYVALTAEQIDDLTGQVPVANADFAASYKPRFSADGKQLLGLLGFSFVEIELSNTLFDNASLTVTADPYRKNPFWAKSGMRAVPWEEMYTSIDLRPDKGNSAQIYARTAIAATRTDNAKCGYILNSEA